MGSSERTPMSKHERVSPHCDVTSFHRINTMLYPGGSPYTAGSRSNAILSKDTCRVTLVGPRGTRGTTIRCKSRFELKGILWLDYRWVHKAVTHRVESGVVLIGVSSVGCGKEGGHVPSSAPLP